MVKTLKLYLLCSVIYSLENLPKGPLAYPLLFGEDYLWIHFLKQKKVISWS